MVDIEDIKAYMNIVDDDYDTIIESILNTVIAVCNNYTNNVLDGSEVTEYYTGRGDGALILKHYPCSNLSEIIEIDPFNNVETELDTSSFYLGTAYKSNKLYYLNNSYTANYIYKITYASGYETAPDDLKQVIIEMVTTIFKESDIVGNVKGGRLGVDSVNESVEGMSNNIKYKDLTERHRTILSKYKIPAF